MKVVQINATCGKGSTGKICVAVSGILNEDNIENYILYSSDKSDFANGIKFASDSDIKIQAIKSRLLGNYGFNSKKITKRLIAELDRIKPDVVHLHNLHSHNCNLEILFDYFKTHNTKLCWTFHDCWEFTGYCPYYDAIQCSKWKEKCFDCAERKKYSLLFDRSTWIFNQKKKLFSGLDLTIVTPSVWIQNEVKKSFLKDYDTVVIKNGIDLSVFKPCDSDFRKRIGCEDKIILLGVAFDWGPRKGLDVFVELSKRLDERFQIVMVGTDDSVDKQLTKNIISIHRTQNQKELAEIYSAVDLFVNPTREEMFGLVNVEALACGTPVISFDTGGCPEIVDSSCGTIVPKNDIDMLESEIIRICETKPYSKNLCIERAKHFDMDMCFREYAQLYKELAND